MVSCSIEKSPSQLRSEFLWLASKEFLQYLLPAGSYFSQRLWQVCGTLAVEPPKEALRSTCEVCEIPLYPGLSFSVNAKSPIVRCSFCGHNNRKKKPATLSLLLSYISEANPEMSDFSGERLDSVDRKLAINVASTVIDLSKVDRPIPFGSPISVGLPSPCLAEINKDDADEVAGMLQNSNGPDTSSPLVTSVKALGSSLLVPEANSLCLSSETAGHLSHSQDVSKPQLEVLMVAAPSFLSSSVSELNTASVHQPAVPVGSPPAATSTPHAEVAALSGSSSVGVRTRAQEARSSRLLLKESSVTDTQIPVVSPALSTGSSKLSKRKFDPVATATAVSDPFGLVSSDPTPLATNSETVEEAVAEWALKKFRQSEAETKQGKLSESAAPSSALPETGQTFPAVDFPSSPKGTASALHSPDVAIVDGHCREGSEIEERMEAEETQSAVPQLSTGLVAEVAAALVQDGAHLSLPAALLESPAGKNDVKKISEMSEPNERLIQSSADISSGSHGALPEALPAELQMQNHRDSEIQGQPTSPSIWHQSAVGGQEAKPAVNSSVDACAGRGQGGDPDLESVVQSGNGKGFDGEAGQRKLEVSGAEDKQALKVLCSGLRKKQKAMKASLDRALRLAATARLQLSMAARVHHLTTLHQQLQVIPAHLLARSTHLCTQARDQRTTHLQRSPFSLSRPAAAAVPLVVEAAGDMHPLASESCQPTEHSMIVSENGSVKIVGGMVAGPKGKSNEQNDCEQKASEQASELKASEQKSSEQDSEQKTSEQKTSDKKDSEQKASEQEGSEQKAIEQKASEQKACEQKACEQKARKQKDSEQMDREQKASEQKASPKEAGPIEIAAATSSASEGTFRQKHVKAAPLARQQRRCMVTGQSPSCRNSGCGCFREWRKFGRHWRVVRVSDHYHGHHNQKVSVWANSKIT